MARNLFVAALMVLMFGFASIDAGAKVEIRAEGFYVDGEYFYPVGVNYWPRSSAVWMWKRYDPEEIRKEFRLLKSMGLNCARVFINWDDLNPEPGKISEENVTQIAEVLDIAREEGIMVIPTHFTGHMSGKNWAPKWMMDQSRPGIFRKEPFRPPTLTPPRTYRDIYEDERAMENALLQARVLAERFKDHPAILYWDFGNEPQYWQRPRTPALGQEYVRRVVDEIKKYDPNHPVSFGMGKFAEDTGFHSYGEFGINHVQDFYIVHTYPAGYYPYSAKVVDQYSTYYAEFENSLSRVSGQPVQFQEFGQSDQMLMAMGKAERAERLAGYYRCSLWGAQIAGAQAGALAWMSGDYVRRIFFHEPYLSRSYELDFGQYDQDYRLKASGEELSRFAKIMEEIAQEPLTPHFDPVAILLPVDYLEYPHGKGKELGKFTDSHRNYNRFLFSSWLTLRQLGINPVFLASTDDLSGIRLLIVAGMSKINTRRPGLNEYINQGGDIYMYCVMCAVGKLGDADMHYGLGLMELENAMSPEGWRLDVLRQRYERMLEDAEVTPPVSSSEPFVEASILSGKYLVLINHKSQDVESEVSFRSAHKIKRCFYGKHEASAKDRQPFMLPAFGVEVCEVESL
jgi:beta-galactosidase